MIKYEIQSFVKEEWKVIDTILAESYYEACDEIETKLNLYSRSNSKLRLVKFHDNECVIMLAVHGDYAIANSV